MQPEEKAIELVLLVHFYAVRSSGGLCMAAVKKLTEFARNMQLENVAKVLDELEEIKNEMPRFMHNHGMPIKALAWTGGDTPTELSADGMINTARYSWDPKTDQMKIMVPKIFH